MRRAAILLPALLMLLACGGKNNSSPTDPATEGPRGTLSGAVTIGPNCPVETTAGPCPPPPGAYALRKVLVESEDGSKVLFTADIDEHGFYRIDLVPGVYTIDLKKNGADRSADVPAKVTITQSVATVLNINIDTGLR
ncbi:MAG TPA: hypothetical protein VH087_06030 [Thermoanaerobaculia bacterium]|nr:hypothetical protein [Thermoanaerobaculia bacterium]